MKNKILELKNVSKVYELGGEELFALNNVSLAIKEGEFMAIVGASGSGKSTLMHVASLLDTPSRGEVFVNGKDVSNLSEEERALLRNKAIGFVFQQFNLLPRTSALENAALPLVYSGVEASTRDKMAKEILTKVGLGDRLLNTPAQLSGGQQQRVAIARALINNPAVIFADEPTGNLDTKSGEEIKQLLKALSKDGRTIVIVTHDSDLARIAKRVVTLKDGKIITDKKTRQ